VNADHAAQLRLLDLQAADTALAQLAHRRRTLPEIAALAESEQRVATLGTDAVDAETRAQDIAAEQRRLENEVDTVRARAVRDEQRLQAGGLPSRELESLQHEIASLSRRQSTLEDDLLEVMEQREQLDLAAAGLRAEVAKVQAEQDELVAARDAALAEIEAAAAKRTAERDTLAADLPADLVALYERVRNHGGIGAAMLRQRRCEGCHIELAGSELAAVRTAPSDAVLRCDNCRCILVRTDESGL
jgi:hypothetical protein